MYLVEISQSTRENSAGSSIKIEYDVSFSFFLSWVKNHYCKRLKRGRNLQIQPLKWQSSPNFIKHKRLTIIRQPKIMQKWLKIIKAFCFFSKFFAKFWADTFYTYSKATLSLILLIKWLQSNKLTTFLTITLVCCCIWTYCTILKFLL